MKSVYAQLSEEEDKKWNKFEEKYKNYSLERLEKMLSAKEYQLRRINRTLWNQRKYNLDNPFAQIHNKKTSLNLELNFLRRKIDEKNRA